MDAAALRALFTEEQRINARPGGFRREWAEDDDGLIIRHVSEMDQRSWLIYSRIRGAGAAQAAALDRLIDREIAYFNPLGHTFEWKVYDYDQPPDLVERLRARGFQIGEPETLMILDLSADPPLLADAPGVDVRRIRDEAGVWAAMTILDRVWVENEPVGRGHQELGDYLIKRLTDGRVALSMFTAYVDDVPASCAWIDYERRPDGYGQFAGLYGGATLAEYRGRGLYTGLLRVRAAEARQRGVRFLTIDASPMSRPICAKHGFIPLAITTPCEYVPTNDSGAA